MTKKALFCYSSLQMFVYVRNTDTIANLFLHSPCCINNLVRSHWSAPAHSWCRQVFILAPSWLVYAAPQNSPLLHCRVLLKFWLIGGLQDTMLVVLSHSSITKNCQLIAVGGTWTWILQDTVPTHWPLNNCFYHTRNGLTCTMLRIFLN